MASATHTPRAYQSRACRDLDPRPCESCRRPYTPVRLNQKVCRPCRLLKDLEYWSEAATKPAACRLCSAAFLRSSRNDQVCASCDPKPWVGACVSCGDASAMLARPETPICVWCVKDPQEGARTHVTTRLRRHVGLDRIAPTEHPAVRAVRAAALVAADRLGCSDAQAIERAKAALGLPPGAQTTDLAALTDALEALHV